MTDIDERMDKLEQMIVLTLEKLEQIGELFLDDSLVRKEEALIYKYGEYVDKSTAARDEKAQGHEEREGRGCRMQQRKPGDGMNAPPSCPSCT